MTLKTLRNLTLHAQSAREQEIALGYGLEVTVDPEGLMIESGQAGFDAAVAELALRLRECAQRGEAVLLGGHTGLWVAALLAVCRVSGETAAPPCYCFDTARIQDAAGRFVFEARGLLRVA